MNFATERVSVPQNRSEDLRRYADALSIAEQPSYRILAFQNREHQHMHYTRQEDGSYKSNNQIGGLGTQGEYFLMNNENYFIKTVERASDGLVLSVGDRITYTTIVGPVLVSPTIREFEFIKTHIFIRLSSDTLLNLEFPSIKVERAPVTTTQDGVVIFDPEQSIYPLNNQFHKCLPMRAKNVRVGSTDRFFSTEEARDTYIFNNKPLLSYREVTMYVPTAYLYFKHVVASKLKHQNG
jgi:hypothetical protein